MTDDLIRAGYMHELDWAISLSQRNLSELREGDWLNLREELYGFLQAQEDKRSFFEKATRETVEKIQRELKIRFDQCADNYAGWEKKRSSDAVLAISPFDASRTKFHLMAYPPDFLFRQTIQCEDLKTAVLLELNNILTVSGMAMSQIRRCPNCSKLFLLRMKPRRDRNFYCSRKCSGLVATRDYRAREAAQTTDPETAHTTRTIFKDPERARATSTVMKKWLMEQAKGVTRDEKKRSDKPSARTKAEKVVRGRA